MKKVTMRDIGKAVGVSAVTVSKAMAGESGVSEVVRQKILQTAAEMGYVNPNVAKHQEKRGLDIGVLIPERFFGEGTYYAMLYKLLVQSLADAGHFCLLELLEEAEENALVQPNLIRNRRVDGLILLGQPTKAYLQLIAAQTTPVVFLDFYDDQARADAVVGDNTYGCYRLTSHLIKNGHKDIGFIGDTRATSSIMDRYLGFMRAMITHDLPIRPECVVKERDERGNYIHLELPEKLPTAFVCNCDNVARHLIEQLKQEGVRVPEDVSVVGFDDYLPGGAIQPALSTFRLDYQTIIDTAVKLIVDRCNGVVRLCGRVVVGGYPVYRDSDRVLSENE